MFRIVKCAWAIVAALSLSADVQAEPTKQGRPNIVWIVVEDMSPNFGCYGKTAVQTPNVDRLASEGMIFRNAVVTAPVCSACRSALITGMYQTSIGAHHHRSGRGKLKIDLPGPVTPVPQLFQQAGYQSLNLTFEDFTRPAHQVAENAAVPIAKTDYNFVWDPEMYDKLHWSGRPGQQPFFCQIQLRGGKYRGDGGDDRWPKQVQETLGSRTDANDVELPPYLPRHPVILEDWAQYLDTVRFTDWQVGKIIDRLRESGELHRTFLFFITDHGISHVRNKQFCYDGGLHIPLIVRGPMIAPGTVRDDPVEHIDLAATSLALAGIAIPSWMQSRDILSNGYVARQFSVSARDRCDETVDRIRALRSGEWKYIRNFYPARPYLSPNRYKDNKPIVQVMRQLNKAGKLDDAQAKIMARYRPAEELYDLVNDPFELRNLADNPGQNSRLLQMRQTLNNWIVWSGDRGQSSEDEAMYDSDMAVYIGGRQRRRPDQAAELQRNIGQMKEWAAAEK
jgi:arylsulfatase A-like enzyme